MIIKQSKDINMARKKKELTVSKEDIKQKLSSDPKWIEKALLVLLNQQTAEEVNVETTIEDNKVGFNGYDAKYLTYCAKWVLRGKHLNEQHLKKCGERLPKYWKQISKVIEAKAQEKKEKEVTV
jgi:hypothetical protein